MRYIVPQFIDVEDKIIGPLSVRQFILILLTGGAVYLEFKVLSFYIFVLAALITVGIGLSFAFVRVNGQSLHYTVLNILQNMQKSSLRVWKKSGTLWMVPEKIIVPKNTYVVIPKQRVRTSRLKELSLIVDTGGTYRQQDSHGK